MALSSEQRKVLARIRQVAQQVGASPKEVKAAVETGLVESNLRNLSGGDADSAGWRQERASLYKDPRNLDASIARFFQETRAVKGKYGTAGALAAAVQRPAAQYRDRYQQRSGEAQALLGGSSSPAGFAARPSAVSGMASGSTTVEDPEAAKRVGFANYLLRTNPQSMLLRLGVVSPDEPTTIKTSGGTSRGTETAAQSMGAAATQGSSSFAKGHSQLLELIHNTGNGGGYAVKNGQKVNGPQFYSAVWAGHQNHVHVAAGPRTIVQLGKLAEKYGLHVGENPHFGTVHQVHAQDSYHYKGEAIDVSGDPARMNAYARKVQQLYGIH